MVKRTLKNTIPRPKLKYELVIRSTYYDSLTDVLEYGLENFGKIIMRKFIATIRQKLGSLINFPDANPKCRFIDSTERKTYRNIIVKGFYIVYCIKGKDIVVLDIVHQSINPERFKKYEES
jgi:plasmid stabilization system protein ParE